MKSLFLFILLLVFQFEVKAQNTFQYIYDNNNDSYVAGYKAMELPNGEIFLNPVNETAPMFGFREANLLRLDAGGNILWSKSYIAPGKHINNNTFEQIDSNRFVLSGSTFDKSTGALHNFLMQVDEDGNINWAKSYESPGGGSFRALSLGISKDKSSVMSNTRLLVDDSSYSTIMKIDTLGNSIYSKKISTATNYQIFLTKVIPTEDGGVAIVGHLYYENEDRPTILIKIDATGAVEWSKTYRITGMMNGGSGTQTSDGGYIISGTALIRFGEYGYMIKAYLLKTDSIGNIQWSKTFSYQYDEISGHEVIEDENGSFVMTGSIKTNVPMAENCFFMLKTDPNGQVLWNRFYGGSIGSQNMIRSLQKTVDGGFLASGEKLRTIDTDIFLDNLDAYLMKTDSLGYVSCNIYDLSLADSLHNFIEQDVDLVLTDEMLTPVNLNVYIGYVEFTKREGCTMDIDESEANLKFRVHPNPSSGVFQVTGTSTFDKVAVLDIFGRTIFTNVGPNVQTVDMSVYPSGIYFVRIYSGNKMMAYEKIIVQ